MTKLIKTRIQLKYDSYAAWTDESKAGLGANLILGKGEIGLCAVESTSVATTAPTVLFKVGDGVHTFKELKWASALAADVHAWAKQAELPVERADAEGVIEGNVISSIRFEDGKVKYTTATVATSEGLAQLTERVTNIENGYATDDDLAQAVEAINGTIATLATKAELQEVDGKFANYYTKTEADAEFATPAEVIEAVNKAIDDVANVDSITNITTLVEYANANAGTIGSLIAEVYGDSAITETSRIDTAIADSTKAKEDAATAVSTANGAATVAGEAKTAAEGAVEVANSAKEIAETAQDSAKSYAEAAEGSANTASGHADTASAKAGEAATSAANALASENAAAGSAATAESMAQAASASAGTASTKADEAAQSAVDAGNAKTAAESAKEAAVIARDAAGNAKIAAEAARDGAAASEANAKASETNAANSESAAAGSAATADEKATAAAGSASAAALSESNAAGSAILAGEKAEAAAQSATDAGVAKEAAETAKGAAETAQGLAEDARDAAIAAKEAAEASNTSATAIATEAKTTADEAKTIAENAKTIVDENVAKIAAINNAETGILAQAKKDSADKAVVALSEAQKYADGLAVNYATAAQGAKADTAIQTISTPVGTNGEPNGLKVVQTGTDVAISFDETVIFVFDCGSATEVI